VTGSGASQPPPTSGGVNQPAQPADQPGGWGVEQPSGPQAAGIGKRIGAFLIDYIGLSIVIGILAVATGAIEPGSMGFGSNYLLTVILAVIILAYFAVLEAKSGQTLGKKLLSIRAVKADGSSLEISDGVKRRIPFVIGSLIPIPILGPLVSLGLAIAILVTAAQDTPYNRGLHDKWADTMVVRA
jgi:uncharacterized RDD family membrane protein YckC